MNPKNDQDNPTLTAMNADERPCACGKGNRSDMERIPRTWLMKTFLFWLPIRRYHCYRCLRNRWL